MNTGTDILYLCFFRRSIFTDVLIALMYTVQIYFYIEVHCTRYIVARRCNVQICLCVEVHCTDAFFALILPTDICQRVY